MKGGTLILPVPIPRPLRGECDVVANISVHPIHSDGRPEEVPYMSPTLSFVLQTRATTCRTTQGTYLFHSLDDPVHRIDPRHSTNETYGHARGEHPGAAVAQIRRTWKATWFAVRQGTVAGRSTLVNRDRVERANLDETIHPTGRNDGRVSTRSITHQHSVNQEVRESDTRVTNIERRALKRVSQFVRLKTTPSKKHPSAGELQSTL